MPCCLYIEKSKIFHIKLPYRKRSKQSTEKLLTSILHNLHPLLQCQLFLPYLPRREERATGDDLKLCSRLDSGNDTDLLDGVGFRL